jgi:hypothetical protein
MKLVNIHNQQQCDNSLTLAAQTRTCIVPVPQAVDVHPRSTVSRGVWEKNGTKEVDDPRSVVVCDCPLVSVLWALNKPLPKPAQ